MKNDCAFKKKYINNCYYHLNFMPSNYFTISKTPSGLASPSEI